jgi:hypothetical protein
MFDLNKSIIGSGSASNFLVNLCVLSALVVNFFYHKDT